MNKLRRRELRELIRGIAGLQNDDDLDNCINTLESILWDEQSYYDNIPENLQYSDRAITSEEAIEHIENALECLNEALNCEDKYEFMKYMNDAINYIDDAMI